MRVKTLAIMLYGCAQLAACSDDSLKSGGLTNGGKTANPCANAKDGAVTAANAWMRAAKASRPIAAVYLTLCNRAAAGDALTGASFAGAGAAEFHRTTKDEAGFTSMAHIAMIALPPGAPVIFEHGAMHIMLIGLEKDIVAGSAQIVTLEFQNAESIDVAVTVKDAMYSGAQ